MNISYKDLAAIEIPVPPMAEQKTVAEKYIKELRKYMNIIDEAQKHWMSVLDELQSFK